LPPQEAGRATHHRRIGLAIVLGAPADDWLTSADQDLSRILLFSSRRITSLGPPVFHRFNGANSWLAHQGKILREKKRAEWQHPEPEDWQKTQESAGDEKQPKWNP
jgi:hypothetical protein